MANILVICMLISTYLRDPKIKCYSYNLQLKYMHVCVCNIHSTQIYHVNKNFYFGWDYVYTHIYIYTHTKLY